MRYQRMLPVVDAWHWTGDTTTMPPWLAKIAKQDGDNLVIRAERIVIVRPFSWVVKDEFGEILPMSADRFERLYRPFVS